MFEREPAEAEGPQIERHRQQSIAIQTRHRPRADPCPHHMLPRRMAGNFHRVIASEAIPREAEEDFFHAWRLVEAGKLIGILSEGTG